jgi:hypothetical protein
MSNHPDLDWRDHITQLDRLQRAVRVLAEGSGTLRERMDKATSALATMWPEDFPERLRNRAAKVLSIREKVMRFDVAYFDFMTPRERKRFVADIIALYEACLIDIGRTWPRWDEVYPKDVDPPLGTE